MTMTVDEAFARLARKTATNLLDYHLLSDNLDATYPVINVIAAELAPLKAVVEAAQAIFTFVRTPIPGDGTCQVKVETLDALNAALAALLADGGAGQGEKGK